MYSYLCESCGVASERHFGMAEKHPETVKCAICGKRARRDIAADHRGYRNTPGNWPMQSEAMGCHPDQVGEMEAHSRSIGVPTHWTPGGFAVFRSAKHRKAYCEATGHYDRNAGYSDPLPGRAKEE